MLLASLIVAVLVPASVTAFVHADDDGQRIQVVDDVTKNYINDKITEISTKKHTTNKDNSDLAKLQLINDWIDAKESGDIEEARHLSTQITADFPPDEEYTQARPISGMTAKNYHYVTYHGSTEKYWDCRDDSDLLGYVDGSLTGYSLTLYIVSNMHYPYEITDGPQGLNCTTPDWDRSKAKYTETLDPSSNCILDDFTSSTDSEGMLCDELSAGSLVWVQGQSWYEDDLIFSPWASDTIVYVWSW